MGQDVDRASLPAGPPGHRPRGGGTGLRDAATTETTRHQQGKRMNVNPGTTLSRRRDSMKAERWVLESVAGSVSWISQRRTLIEALIRTQSTYSPFRDTPFELPPSQARII